MSVQKRFLIFLLASAIFLFLPKKVLADVLLNELLPNPSSPPDWVELYNGDDEAVDLEGWSLVDSTSEMLIIHEATISAHGFLVFDVTNRLNQSNDTIRLLNQTSEEQDSYEYTSNPGTNVSYGRMPDGKSWGICQVPTKGGPNSCVVPTPTPTPAPTNTPTPGPTNTPTPTLVPPTPTPTKKLTPTLTPTPTPTAMPTLTPTPTGEVLGEETPPEEQPRRNLLPFILIGSGLLLLFGSAVPLILPKFKKGDILKKDEKNQKVD